MQELILETGSSIAHDQKEFEMYENFLSTSDSDELLLAFGWLDNLKITPFEDKLKIQAKIKDILVDEMSDKDKKEIEAHWNKTMLERELQREFLNKLLGANVTVERMMSDNFEEKKEEIENHTVDFENLPEDLKICFKPIVNLCGKNDILKIIKDDSTEIISITKKELELSNAFLKHLIAAAKTKENFGSTFFLGIYAVDDKEEGNATGVRLTFVFKK